MSCNGCFVEEMDEEMNEAKTSMADPTMIASSQSSSSTSQNNAPSSVPPQAHWGTFGGQPMQFMYFGGPEGPLGGGFGGAMPFPPFAPPPFAQSQQQQQQQPPPQQQQQQQPPLFNSFFGNFFQSAFGPPPGQAQPGFMPFNLDMLMGQMLGMPSQGGLNMGDYRGANIQDILAQLMAQDPNRHGPPPAAEQAVGQLPEIKMTAEQLDDLKKQEKLTECAVCKEEFTTEDLLKRMPCAHQFHPDCLIPWLKMHNTCPVCRFALPTDDVEYERRRAAQAVASNQRSSNQTSAQTSVSSSSSTTSSTSSSSSSPSLASSTRSSSSAQQSVADGPSTSDLERMPNPWAGL